MSQFFIFNFTSDKPYAPNEASIRSDTFGFKVNHFLYFLIRECISHPIIPNMNAGTNYCSSYANIYKGQSNSYED